ncbi:TrkH family potassium uptake protein [Lacrimispora saccharolytica]|uniref:TrkH family potassium uptake protein n=1 Tax=Lacrimispora saccharolytica TaxID=84030 RepID=UPI00265CC3CF|nr:potassium transporter TrkG [Lacrimispora saccharolytica]MCF2655879.1 Trk family potassium uptake protein [Lacrimispora saccharolytica]
MKNKNDRHKLTSFQVIILGFIAVILIGALLLMLPVSSREGRITSFSDALFTSTSAVCVTGLVVRDTASYWSAFGQAVLLILIQIGGLGVVSVASFAVMLSGKKISLSQRQTLQNAVSAPNVGGILRLLGFIFKGSLIVEAIGALLLLPVFIPALGPKGIWYSVFHSISAFCNAGFDLNGNVTGEYSSLTGYLGNMYLTVVIVLLIFLGGLGFLTWKDFIAHRLRFKEYRMQSKVIIITSFILVVIPFTVFFFLDFNNLPMGERLSAALFHAVTPRTAGFNMVDFSTMTHGGIAITMVLMLIGGSPGSTAGGMKTTTFAVIVGNTLSTIKRRDNANFFRRRIGDGIVKSASALLFLYVSLSVVGAIIISECEGVSMGDALFETISAIGTVGLSLGITPTLNIISRLVLIFLMFFGRVGGLTIIYAAFSKRDTYNSKFPMENITVG